MNIDNALFMNVNTGSVDTYENWVADYLSTDGEEREAMWPSDVDSCINQGSLVEVYCDSNGDYVEIKQGV